MELDVDHDQADQNIIEFSDEDDIMLNWDEPAANIVDLPSDDDVSFDDVQADEDFDWKAHYAPRRAGRIDRGLGSNYWGGSDLPG